MCVCPFLCSHPGHQRDHPDQFALLFEGTSVVLSRAPPLCTNPLHPSRRTPALAPLALLATVLLCMSLSSGKPAQAHLRSPSFGYVFHFHVRESAVREITTPSLFINTERHQHHPVVHLQTASHYFAVKNSRYEEKQSGSVVMVHQTLQRSQGDWFFGLMVVCLHGHN